MANNENLVSLATRTTKEKREIGVKGGIASGKARREKATMKSTLQAMLEEKPKGSDLTYRQLATLGLLKGAVKGNSQNYKTIVETLGELFNTETNNSNGVITELIEALSNAKRDN